MSNINISEKRLQGMIAFVVSQTDYDETKALIELKNNDYDAMNVIRIYLNPNLNKKEKIIENNSINKIMMSEYRKFLDNANKDYRKRQEIKHLYKNFVNNSNNKQKNRINKLEQDKKYDKNIEKNIDIEEID